MSINKLEELKKLREHVNLVVKNLDNYPKDEINVLVSNHNCLMDIFYLPMALPEEIISLISARLVYKNENNRKEIVNRYLNAMPIEAHGGIVYANMCLEGSIKLLENGKSVSIFPEGAYVPENKIFRGRTGASRMVYLARSKGKKINLIPISISISRNDNLDDYNVEGDNVEINILPSIDYEDAYYNYRNSQLREEKNMFLHQPIDKAMQCIADSLNIPYDGNYIELRPKGNVMFEDGSVVDVNTAKKPEFYKRYYRELNERTLQLLKK